MTLPPAEIRRRAQVAMSHMADRDTPFIFDEWYVAAFAEEIGRSLLKRTLLGKRVVLFRTEAGTAVALADRCAHRSFPLSASQLDGDTIVCGYHGFRYNAQGDCIDVPSQAQCPKNIGVKNYALFECGPLVWIWMGNADEADPAKLPEQAWLSGADWERSQGYFRLEASYVALHENLLDLTHLSFLHAGSFGTPDYARAAFENEIRDGYYALRRNIVPTTLPPVWAKPTGLDGVTTAARLVKSEFKSPAFHQVNVTFHDSALPPEARRETAIKTAHLPTPETQESTHYFIVHGRDFALRDEAVTEFMHENLFVAFQEDVTGLALQREALETSGDDIYEFSVASDAPAAAMRTYLKTRALDEPRRHEKPAVGVAAE
jgi:phenylpropionate dioxygenase-like ring-hydroxylating dioxygenase large terminal subunit